MLKIAICDDDIHELSKISNLIELYREKNSSALTYKVFNSGIELLESIHSGDYDILILDILMPGTDGMQVAKEIRSFDTEVKIIFLTSSTEFAVKSYSVNAYYYLLKPGTQERLFPILDRIFIESQNPKESFTIKHQSGILRIPFEKLEFLEIANKKLKFNLSDGSINEISGTLANYENDFLSRPEFIKVHRSYIVNMHWIHKMTSSQIVTYSKKNIPISRLIYTHAKECYMKFLFFEKGVE